MNMMKLLTVDQPRTAVKMAAEACKATIDGGAVEEAVTAAEVTETSMAEK